MSVPPPGVKPCPIRLAVWQIMVAVALVAICLALGRVHISLGSSAFGVLSVAWVRTARVLRDRPVAIPPARASGIALASAVEVALLLVLCLIPAGLLLPLMMAMTPVRSHQKFYDTDAFFWYFVIAGALTIPVVRISARFGSLRRERGAKRISEAAARREIAAPTPAPESERGPGRV